MKKNTIFLALPFVFLLTLSAQITQEQADKIVINHITNDTKPHTIFAKKEVQTDGYTVITSKGEMLELDYSCFVYYVKYNEETNGKYLIIKENNGNLLEVNTKSDEGPGDLYKWCDLECEKDLFYYYNKEKIFLSKWLLRNWLIIGYEKQIEDEELINYINQTDLFNPVETYHFYHWSQDGDFYNVLFVNTKKEYTCSQLEKIIKGLEQSDLIVFANLTFKSQLWFGGEYYDIMACIDEFVVSLKDESDSSDLEALVQETNTRIKRISSIYIHTYYYISADKNSDGNALQMANYFSETKKFRWAEPNLINVKFTNKSSLIKYSNLQNSNK